MYDRDGIVDDYILEQIRDLRSCVEFIHCVIDGKLTPAGKTALESLADEVYVRENRGNDIGAYKAAIAHIGWEKLSQYDELVLMNHTCYGPVYPFHEVFDWAAQQDADFWALTDDLKSESGDTSYLHYYSCETHYQSQFLVFR